MLRDNRRGRRNTRPCVMPLETSSAMETPPESMEKRDGALKMCGTTNWYYVNSVALGRPVYIQSCNRPVFGDKSEMMH